MKAIVISAAVALTTLGALADTLPSVPVDADAIACAFNTNCTTLVTNQQSALVLAGTTGTGYVHSTVIVGEAGSSLAGRYGYQYRIDLSGVLPSPADACVTNVVRWTTNRLLVVTNVLVCRTSMVGVIMSKVCVTNRFPATNIVVCVTNSVPGQSIQRCFTNSLGVVTCVTNVFPPTNYVYCVTNRIPARREIVCQTNIFDPGSNVVICVTKERTYVTNVVSVRTNTIPCPGAAPCLEWIRIPVGRLASHVDLDSNGVASDWVYVVTNNSANVVFPDPIFRRGSNIVLRFSPPLCPGESSLTVGFISNDPPALANARGELTSGSNVVAAVLASHRLRPIDCDLGPLIRELRNLETINLLGATPQIRRDRRAALLDLAGMAVEAARSGNAADVLSALDAIGERTDGGVDDWVTPSAAKDIKKAISKILKCINGGDDDDEDDDDDHSDHKHGKGKDTSKSDGDDDDQGEDEQDRARN